MLECVFAASRRNSRVAALTSGDKSRGARQLIYHLKTQRRVRFHLRELKAAALCLATFLSLSVTRARA